MEEDSGRPYGQPAGRATPRVSLCGESRPYGDHQAQGSETESEPQIDNSFTGLQAQQRRMFLDVLAEAERLKEALVTVRVNAMRSSPSTRSAFVSFCDMGLREVLAGATLSQAIRTWDGYQKCSGCGAAAGMLANGLCFECTPEGHWPAFSASVDTHPQGGDATEIAAPFMSGAAGEAGTPKGTSHAD